MTPVFMSKELSPMRSKFAPLSLAALAFAAACGDSPTAADNATRGITSVPVKPVLSTAGGSVSSALGGSSTTPVSLKPTSCQASQTVTVTYTVTGKQDQPASFKVNTYWTNSTGSWVGSVPATVNVPARSNGAGPVSYPVNITIVNGAGTTTGTSDFRITPFYLVTFAVTNGGDLNVRNEDAAVYVAFAECPVTNTPPTLVVPSNLRVAATSAAGAMVSFSSGVTATDAQDGSLTAVCTPASGGIFAIGTTTVNCSVQDSGGLTASGSFTITVFDNTPPAISSVLNPLSPDGNNGWYKSAVTLTWTVSEPETPSSLVTTGCVDQNISADQQATTYPCSATSDGGATIGSSVTIKRDATAPSVSLHGGPVDGTSYYYGSVPAAPTCSANDATSGLVAACEVTGYSAAVGTHTVSSTVSDNAGNQSTASATYTVLAWTIKGFYSPVNMGAQNTVKAGSSVPLKFEVFAADELTATSVVKSFTVKLINCSTQTGLGEDPIDMSELSTGGTNLRYDATGGQFIQNWQTPKVIAACYLVTLTTQDGTHIAASFKTK